MREVYRDEFVVAFFPTDPAVLGHTMIVPRQHVPDIWSVDEDAAGHLARATVRLAAAVREAVKPEGLNVIQSNGAAATQSVFHLHVHLVPRWEGDAIRSNLAPGNGLPRGAEGTGNGRGATGMCGVDEAVSESDGDACREDLHKHLDFIQSVVTRMSAPRPVRRVGSYQS